MAGAPESAVDVVALLAAYGRECAGAVVALPAGSDPPGPGRYEPLTDDGLEALVRGLPEHPLGTDLERDIRMSLAGAQPKFLLARIDGSWHEPVAGAPSTHIVKPAGVWAHSAHNEALALHLARRCGLTTADAWTEQMGSTTVLVAERAVVTETLEELTSTLRQAVGELPTMRADGWPSEVVLGIVSGRLDRLDRGEPLGDPRGGRRRNLTLDSVTAGLSTVDRNE